MTKQPKFLTCSATVSILLASFAFSASALANEVMTYDRTAQLDRKHKDCLERIADDSELAYEEAMIWRDDGGGRRAKHCEAMALFALGHEGEAARRLDELAKASDGGSPQMRADFFAEAANFWIAAGEATFAYQSATDGLKLVSDHEDLRVSRARAYAASGRYDYAEAELTNILAINSKRADALRYRADAKLKQDKLYEALDDIEASLRLDETQVETALLRGEIREKIRLKEAEAIANTATASDDN